MNEVLMILALSAFASSDVKVEMTTEPALVYDMEITYPRPELVQYAPCWGCYRSPYHYYYPGPGYRTPYYGTRHGYWGPRWQHDYIWNFNRYRQGW